jgi:polysaccharide biosynthesis/export protein
VYAHRSTTFLSITFLQYVVNLTCIGFSDSIFFEVHPVDQRVFMKKVVALLTVAGLFFANPVFAQRAFTLGTARSTYRVGPGDSLRVGIYFNPTYEGTLGIAGDYAVLPDGTLSLPLVGTLVVSGLEVADITTLLNERYSSYFKKAIVSVNLGNLRPVRVILTGEITKPGPYELKSGSTLAPLLQLAGGLTEEADVRQVEVTQASGDKRTVNLWDLIAESSENRDILLTDGDRISIPKALETESAEVQLVARSTLGQGKLRIRLLGDVNTWVAVDANTPYVPLALNQGGVGPADTTLFDIQIVRQGDDGQAIKIPYIFNAETAFIKDTPLQSGDILIVARRPIPIGQAILNGIQTVFVPTTQLLTNIIFLRNNFR